MTFLSLYRPNFCAHCGCKIIRLQWRLWTSRTFCTDCTAKFRRDRVLQKLLLTLAIFCFGAIVGRALKTSPPPVVIQRPGSPVESSSRAQNEGLTTQPSIEEEIYICGARTKKGTPCSRRVHGAVRCWQHKGLPAMLPLEKLRIRD